MKPLFFLTVLCSVAFAQVPQCRIAGQVFFADVFDHRITVKTDPGDLVSFNYDATTHFVRAGSALQPADLNNGDRLCLGMSQPLVVTVIPRAQIEADQRKELASWQADSLYGVVSEVDRRARRITLEVSIGSKTTRHPIELNPDAAYWLVPADLPCLSDAVPGSLDRISTGDRVYVRGSKTGDVLEAYLVISGGFRSFAATIDTMEILDDAVRVHLAISGNPRTVHVRSGDLYTINPTSGASSNQTRQLYPIEAADLQPGDTALVFGVEQAQDSVGACALIVGFSPAGCCLRTPVNNFAGSSTTCFWATRI